MTDQITVPRETWDAMREALEGIMRWQVKNVNVWHNSAYDIAHAALTAANAVQPQAQSDSRSLTLAKQQWEHWNQYALELQERLVKYEGGAPMVLNATNPQATEPAWRPIESAPKDGTTVLTFRVLNGEPQITDARWFNGTGTWGQRSWRYPEHDGPTHWMPLPAAPEAP